MGDVVIGAPIARALTPTTPHLVPSKDEIIQLQGAQISELEAKVESLSVTAATIANAAINMLDRLSEHGYGSRDLGVVIERDTWEKTRGLRLTVEGDEKTGKVVVRARQSGGTWPIAAEDRSGS